MIDALAPTHELEWEEAAIALLRAKGLKSGLWRIGVKLQFAAVTGQWQHAEGGQAHDAPTGLIGMAGFALFAVTEPGPMVFDAATGKAAPNKVIESPAARPAKGAPLKKASKPRRRP